MRTLPARRIGRPLLLVALTLSPGCSRTSPPMTATAPGELRLPGLSSPATVATDRYGIPHVRAANLHDLYLAWGFVTGRDRLWQLMLTRARAQGHSHLWLGNEALAADGAAQLFRLRERAEAIWQRDRRDSTLAGAIE
ncbi:MAG TPA: penicillin acylase family protein, partial [Candidatus Acidoferrales bacterium]|nr:penicillin acylase family protein [Candidatus Acidoferrales bacterium]